MDDIGDYLLFRNTLAWYKQSEKWKGYEITLLGNEAFESIYGLLDSKTTDKTIWINKHRYTTDEAYRREKWVHLKNEKYAVVICPSRTRPLLLDDLCALCCKNAVTIATENTFRNKQVNKISDAVYTQLFPFNKHLHEFNFNQEFAAQYTGNSFRFERPFINNETKPVEIMQPYILCCIGANERSRRWPVKKWVEFINLCVGANIANMVICGGPSEKRPAEIILQHTKAVSITGSVSLVEFINYAANSLALICNDSMAAHLGVSLGKPVIIISNGNNFPRFTTYEESKLKNVKTVYSPKFLATLKKQKDPFFWNYIAVTKDTCAITASSVFAALRSLLQV